MADNTQSCPERGQYPAIIMVIGSPLRFFGLTALICSAVFPIGAGLVRDPDSFTYCIHMFLAIIALFAAIAIWCPRSLYHPRELQELDMTLPHQPWKVAFVGFLGLVLYMLYMYFNKNSGSH